LEVTLIGALVALAVVVAFALAAILLKALDGRGFLASVGVGYAILIGGGYAWFGIVAVFFTLGVAFTWYQYGYKKKIGTAQEKGGARNWPNILANGGLAAAFAVLELYFGGDLLGVLFLGAISTSAADTVATELGLLYARSPKLITHPRRSVPAGTSGGVTPLGFAGATLASVVIGVIALFTSVISSGFLVLPICVVGGLGGAAVDSILGATLQRKGHCVVCMKPTEALSHCGERTKATGGVPFIENNVVNLLSTAVGAALATAFAVAIASL
jgi:uncharacterized protein (TIGR00297 family)